MNSIRRATMIAGVLAIAACTGVGEVGAQPPANRPPAESPQAGPPAPAIEPAAAAAVVRMGDYLKSLPGFSIHAETTTDEVLVAGPKVQYGGSIDLTYQAPDRLWLKAVHDEKDDQQFFYDGATLSLWIAAKQSWAQVAVPGTVATAIALVESKYDVAFPLGDLLSKAILQQLLTDVQAGIVIGTGRVGGVECDHLGFHQAGADWQVWIEKGDHPVPRKLVITTLGEASQPQHAELLTWDLAPQTDPSSFTFSPPPGAQRIVIAERHAARAATSPTTTRHEAQ